MMLLCSGRIHLSSLNSDPSLPRADASDPEKQKELLIMHPTCWYWPPWFMAEGLYRDVVTERNKNAWSYHVLSMARWCQLILQICFGAIITAIGGIDEGRGGVALITTMGALNTVNAGLMALMHTSGLPDRYRMNRVEFGKMEDFIKEILDTSIVETDRAVDDLLVYCFERFQKAKSTVLDNMPKHYAGAVTGKRGRDSAGGAKGAGGK